MYQDLRPKSSLFKKIFNEDKLAYMFSMLVLGLHHMHIHNIIHRDIKPLNIIISKVGKNKSYKIFQHSDLGTIKA